MPYTILAVYLGIAAICFRAAYLDHREKGSDRAGSTAVALTFALSWPLIPLAVAQVKYKNR